MNEKELSISLKNNNILDLQKACSKLEQVECPIEHTFAEGVYIRTMKAPAGTFVIGKRHKHQTVNIVTKGRALVSSGGNEPAKEIIAPATFVSEPFVKKMAFFIEDTEWINVHPTSETDIDKLEAECIITEESYALLIEEQNKIKGGA